MTTQADRLQHYAAAFGRLVVNVRAGRASPHKVCMLLALLDLSAAGGLSENRVVYGPPLLERYRRYFDAVRLEGDHPNPYFPFFHLKGNLRGGHPSFWHLIPRPGSEVTLVMMQTARSDGDILRHVAYARLDDDLFDLLQEATAALALSDAVARHWFRRGLDELGRIVGRRLPVIRYERSLRDRQAVPTAGEPPPSWVRSPAFRSVVIERYDYRCAATGERVLLDGGEAMVEAAHIHPFSLSGDDDPCNGVALTPDMHWAMDRNLIAPGPDYLWHVSRSLDDRVPDFRRLVGLEGRRMLLPALPAYWPSEAALAWRHERLREPDWRPPRDDLAA